MKCERLGQSSPKCYKVVYSYSSMYTHISLHAHGVPTWYSPFGFGLLGFLRKSTLPVLPLLPRPPTPSTTIFASWQRKGAKNRRHFRTLYTNRRARPFHEKTEDQTYQTVKVSKNPPAAVASGVKLCQLAKSLRSEMSNPERTIRKVYVPASLEETLQITPVA